MKSTALGYLTDGDLRDSDKTLLSIMWEIRSKYGEVCHSTSTLAAMLGLKVRAVQVRLARLVKAGRLRLVRDYAKLSSRRKYVLVNPGDAPSTAAPERTADARPERTAECAQVGPLSDSPIEVPEGEQKEEVSCDAAAAVAEGPQTPGGRASLPDGRPKPRPEEVASLVSKAEGVFGAGIGSQVRAAAGRFGLSWVSRAIDRSKAKLAKGSPVTWGYPITILRGWETEGGPPPESPATPTMADRVDKLRLALDADPWGGVA